MKPSKKYYAFKLGSDPFEKIEDILSGLKYPKLEKLDDPKNVDKQTNSIIFYNVGLPDTSTILRVPRNH
jgi:hypothetical protein